MKVNAFLVDFVKKTEVGINLAINFKQYFLHNTL